MNAKRPRNLGVFHMRLPIGAWVSIVHRMTGVLLVLAIPALLYGLTLSLTSATDFTRVVALMHRPTAHLISALMLWVFAQHFFSGIRHLLLDLDIGVDRRAARRSAAAVFVAAPIVALLLASALW